MLGLINIRRPAAFGAGAIRLIPNCMARKLT